MDGSSHRAPRRPRQAALASLVTVGTLVAAACTAGPADSIRPSPRVGTPSGQAAVCGGKASAESNGTLGCGRNIGFRGLSPAFAVAIQPDGKIVAAGGTGMYTIGSFDNNFALARYNPNGSADQTFGDGGQVATQLEPLQEAHSVAIQADGRIVATGSPTYGGAGTTSLARFNPDGTLDTTFGENGWLQLPWIGRAYAAVVQSDQRIVVAGAGTGAGAGIALARYSSNGSLDPTFGTDGVVTTTVGSGRTAAYAMSVQDDKRIVVAGRAAGALLLARYGANGLPDRTFGTDGLVIRNFGHGRDIAQALGIQPDGRIVVAGRAADRMLLARFESNGSLDDSFGSRGRAIADPARGSDWGRGVAILPGGGIVVAGAVDARPSPDYLSSRGRFAVWRFLRDGGLDRSFGRGGLDTPFNAKQGAAFSVAIQADGGMVVVGLIRHQLRAFALARYPAP